MQLQPNKLTSAFVNWYNATFVNEEWENPE